MLHKLIILVFIIFAFEARADYVNPTSHSDCHYKNYPQVALMRQNLKDRRICHKNMGTNSRNYETVGRTACGNTFSRMCGHFNVQYCELSRALKRLQSTCMAKWNRIRAQKNEFNERQKRAEKDAQRLRAEEERRRDNSRRTSSSTRTGSNRGPLSPESKRILRAQTLTKKVSSLIVKRTGAYALSDRIGKVGTRYILSLNDRALRDLKLALNSSDSNSESNRRYSANNPRPTFAQREKAYQILDRFKEDIKRLESSKYKLPFDNKSVVNTPYGQLLNQVIQARADGKITNLNGSLETYVANLIDKRPSFEASTTWEDVTPSEIREMQREIFNAAVDAHDDNRIAEADRKRRARAVVKRKREKAAAKVRASKHSKVGIQRVGRHSFPKCAIVHQTFGDSGRETLFSKFLRDCGRKLVCKISTSGGSNTYVMGYIQSFYGGHTVDCR